MTPTVLVTGSASALGRKVVHELREHGWRVRTLVHRTHGPPADESIVGSVLDAVACAEAVSGCEAVVHGAAVTHARRAREYRTVNVDGTRHLVQAACAANVDRFLMLSSRTAGSAAGWYAASKLDAEQVITTAKLSWTIIRLAEVYGAESGNGVDQLVARIREGRPIVLPGRGESTLCPLHADDAALACVNALSSDASISQTYVLGGECLTIRGLAERCIELVASPSRIMTLPWAVFAALAFAGRLLPLPIYPDQVRRLRADKPPPSAGALTDLGVPPRSLGDGLRAVLDV